MERVKSWFEALWGQCIVTGSADFMEPYCDEHSVLLGDREQRICRGKAAVVTYMSELVSQMMYLEPEAISYQGQRLSEDLVMIYGLMEMEQISMQFSFCIATDDGRPMIRHCHVSYSNNFAPSDEVGDVCEMLRHISELRRQEEQQRQEALRESEAIYRFVLEATSDLIFDIDLTSKVIHIDREKVAALFEVSLAEEPSIEAVYDQILSAILPADRESVREKFDIYGDTLEVLSQVETLEQEFRINNRAKGYIWLRITMIPIRHGGVITKLVANIKDIDHQKREELEIRRQSERDPLTDLMNRGYTESCINDYLQHGGNDGALLMIDVDNFKLVNDNLGHQAGDKVLQELGQSLETIFRSSDIVGRIGGDEFVVFMKGVSQREAAEKKAQQVNEAFHKAFFANSEVFWISASVGVVMVQSSTECFEELLSKADKAMYTQKRRGKNGCVFYEDCEEGGNEVGA